VPIYFINQVMFGKNGMVVFMVIQAQPFVMPKQQVAEEVQAIGSLI
jgi:hypothetical protein